MAKPIRKYGKGAVSLAVFENAKEDGSRNEFYSLQRSRKVGNEWKNESVLLNKEQLAIVQELAGQALSGEEGASSSSSCSSSSSLLQGTSRQMQWTGTDHDNARMNASPSSEKDTGKREMRYYCINKLDCSVGFFDLSDENILYQKLEELDDNPYLGGVMCFTEEEWKQVNTLIREGKLADWNEASE